MTLCSSQTIIYQNGWINIPIMEAVRVTQMKILKHNPRMSWTFKNEKADDDRHVYSRVNSATMTQDSDTQQPNDMPVTAVSDSHKQRYYF